MARNGSQNGKARSKDKVRVAIIGVGNCANSLLQGVEYYKDASPDEFVPGLMHVDLGGYHVRDIEFTAAFDVTKAKVGKDLADAIWAKPNDTIKFSNVPKTGITVSRGMTHDGLGKYLSEVVEKAPGDTDDVVSILKETGTDVVVNYLPVGSEEATKWYAEQILNAGCAMVNCMPVFIAQGRLLREALRGARAADHRRRHQVAGRRDDHAPRADDALPRARRPARPHDAAERRRQLGLPQHARARAARVEEDLEDERRHVDARLRPGRGQRPRRPVRPRALAHRPQVGLHPHGGHGLRRRAAELELKLEVWDSPNSAGIVIDAVRLAKLALNNGVGGALEGPSAYLMKSPPKQITDDEAHDAVERFIKQYAARRRRKRRRDLARLVPSVTTVRAGSRRPSP